MGVWGTAPAESNFFTYTDKIGANFRKFWHLHLHHCIRLPHHSLENSRTFQDLALKFPGPNPLSRTFQGLGIFNQKIQDFPGGVGTLSTNVPLS